MSFTGWPCGHWTPVSIVTFSYYLSAIGNGGEPLNAVSGGDVPQQIEEGHLTGLHTQHSLTDEGSNFFTHPEVANVHGLKT